MDGARAAGQYSTPRALTEHKPAELVLGLRHTHGRAVHPKPIVSKDAKVEAMLEAAGAGEPTRANGTA